MATLNKCIFFAGGKRIEPIVNDNTVLKFEKKANGAWTVTLSMEIPAVEAKDVIRTFKDFNIEAANLDKTFPNQVFFEALDDNDEFTNIEVDNVKLSVFFDKEDAGSMQFSVVPAFTGKTQNSKTQNAQ